MLLLRQIKLNSHVLNQYNLTEIIRLIVRFRFVFNLKHSDVNIVFNVLTQRGMFTTGPPRVNLQRPIHFSYFVTKKLINHLISTLTPMKLDSC